MSIFNQGTVNIYVPASCLKYGTFGGKGYSSTPVTDYINISGSMSMSMWVNPYDMGHVAPSTGRLFVKTQTLNGWGLYISGQSTANCHYCFRASGGGDQEGAIQQFTPYNSVGACADDKATQVKFNEWTHVMGTYDRTTKRQSIYINGVLASSNINVSGVSIYDGGSLYVASNHAKCNISAQITDVRLWSGACLSPDEAFRVFNGLDIKPNNLVVHYKMLEREGSSIYSATNIVSCTGSIYRAEWNDRAIRCWCSRWDEGNWDGSFEFIMDPCDRNFIFPRVTPGAVRELYNILGTPEFIDTTYTSSNTLIVEPIAGCGVSSLRSRRVIGVKNISDNFLNKDTFVVKMDGYFLTPD